MSERDELDLLRTIARAAMTVVTEARETNDWRDELAIRRSDHTRLWDALAAWHNAFPAEATIVGGEE